MSTLMQANRQWASRPEDERFETLTEMLEHFRNMRSNSKELTCASRDFRAVPAEDHSGLMLESKAGNRVVPSHWAFGQLAALAEAPAGYLRNIPSELAADCINYGLRYSRDVADVGMLLHRDTSTAVLPPLQTVIARALTGPRYGRIWNEDITRGLVARFGNGQDGQFTVPGEFGKVVTVTKANTTLFAGDRDMFVFLADGKNRVEIPNRRDGQSGTLARGFFCWNSEVGASTFGIATFLFDYVCCNRIVWGAKQYKQITIRHTPKAPHRWVDEVAPALEQYAQSSTKSITDAVEAARAMRIDANGGDVNEFLAKRFGKRLPAVLQDVSLEEEGRPIETLWDAATAVTAHARSVKWQDDRVDLERKAGQLLDLAVA